MDISYASITPNDNIVNLRMYKWLLIITDSRYLDFCKSVVDKEDPFFFSFITKYVLSLLDM